LSDRQLYYQRTLIDAALSEVLCWMGRLQNQIDMQIKAVDLASRGIVSDESARECLRYNETLDDESAALNRATMGIIKLLERERK